MQKQVMIGILVLVGRLGWAGPAHGQFCGLPGSCNDDNPCTRDFCLPNGSCAHLPKCLDGNPCTTDSCNFLTGACTFTPTTGSPCDDSNACTSNDACLDGACTGDPPDCDDGIFCSVDSCEPSTGACTHSADNAACDDGFDCTTDTCDPSAGCIRDPVPALCDDGIDCTEDVCHPLHGCLHLRDREERCDDDDACTIGQCDPDQGGCVQYPRFCDDGDKCTVDTCDSADSRRPCQFTPVDCDDKSACTVDSCDAASGCEYEALDCHDGNKCTNDSCDKTTGCIFDAVPCDDGDACTADSCDPALGCTRTLIDCDDGDECTADSCDSKSGCVYEPLDCIDAIACSANEFICKSVDYHDADGDGIIEVGEPTNFDVVIEVQNLTGGPWSGVVVSDRFGGEIDAAVLVKPGVNPTQGTVKISANGATQKQTLAWTIGNLPAGGSATLVITARTDVNPGGAQQYTTCGAHAFNSGAVLKYADSRRVKFSAATGVIDLTVLTADLEGDCDGDGAPDAEELDAGTDPLDPTDVP